MWSQHHLKGCKLATTCRSRYCSVRSQWSTRTTRVWDICRRRRAKGTRIVFSIGKHALLPFESPEVLKEIFATFHKSNTGKKPASLSTICRVLWPRCFFLMLPRWTNSTVLQGSFIKKKDHYNTLKTLSAIKHYLYVLTCHNTTDVNRFLVLVCE